ncbi:MAG: hypothetical protein ACOCY1_00595 [Halovenus sp.]
MSDPDDDAEKRRGDPFEKLDESVGDREGDPFERLDSDGDDTAGDEPARATPDDGSEPAAFDPESNTGDGEGVDDQPVEHDTPRPGTPGADDGSEMRFGIGPREAPEPGEGPSLGETVDREGDPFGSVDSAFAEMDVEQIDPETVWQELTSAQSRGSVGDVQDRTYADVSKHSYCEQCEYFSEPPEVHCTHEGTEIVEFLDMETVRVVDCPVVTEREKLERGDE